MRMGIAGRIAAAVALAACGGSPAGMQATTATLAVLAGDQQATTAGYLLPDTIVVQLRDGDGAPIPYAIIDAQADASFGAPFASVTSLDARTGADGTARFAWRLGLALGAQTLTVRSSGVAAEPLLIHATANSQAVRALGGGDRGLCAVDLGGRLGCWDPLADPDRPPVFAPVATETRFTDLAVYPYHDHGGRGCAAATTGRVWCFDLGDGGHVGGLAELSGAYPPMVHVVTGGADFDGDADAAFCALTAAGEAWCWGNNEGGVLGDGGVTDRATPTPVITPVRFTHLAIGSYHACGLDADKRGWCWGRNDAGQVGIAASATPVVTPVLRRSDFRFDAMVPVTTRATCALVEGGGGAWCWGDTTDIAVGPLINVLIHAPNTTVPIYVASLGAPQAIGRVDGAAVAVAATDLGAWWGDLGAVADLVQAIEPRHFVRSLGLRTLAMSTSRGLVCGAVTDQGDSILCGRMAALTGYPSHQPAPELAGFGVPGP